MRWGGMVSGVTAGAAIAFVVAWFLPWMGDTPAFPLIGHGLDSPGEFMFDTPPGAGTSLELALFGLLGVAAIVAALLTANIGSAVIAGVACLPGVHLALRDHPALSSGPGAVVATIAMVALAVAQIAVVWWPERGSWIVGTLVAALLAVAAGFGGSAYASARDTDIATSKALTPVKVATAYGPLTGITAVDAATGAPRWHHWERDWCHPAVGLRPDGAVAYLEVDTTTGRHAFAFAAATGNLMWHKQVQSGDWPKWFDVPTVGTGPALPIGPGLISYGSSATAIQYFDASGQEATLRLDAGCYEVIGAGGMRTQYLVAHCGQETRVFAFDRNARRLWSTTVFWADVEPYQATVDDRGDTVVVTGDGHIVTLNAGTGKM